MKRIIGADPGILPAAKTAKHRKQRRANKKDAPNSGRLASKFFKLILK